MKTSFSKTFPVLYIYGVIFLLAAWIQLSFKQEQITLTVNAHWNALFDYLFQYITYLGDGFFAVAFGVLVWFKNRKLGLAILMAYASSALVAQAFKHLVFEDMYRPTWVMKEIPLHRVEGVEVFAFNSFPSGHSTTAFALASILAFYFSDLRIRLALFTIAILVCFSRVYLLQHFFQDAFAGSFIGFFMAFIVYNLLFVEYKK